MKSVILSGVCLSLILQAATVSAQTGTITFEGRIVESTCVVTASNSNGEVVDGTQAPNDLTVTLPTVTTSELDASQKVAGRTQFTLVFGGAGGAPGPAPNTSCIPVSASGETLNSISAFFENEVSTVNNAALGLLTNTSDATNVAVQLLGQTFNPIDFNSLDAQINASAADLSNNENTLTYNAQYYALGSSTAGKVQAKVRYSIIYH